LDSQRQSPLLPESGDERVIQLWQHALGDGLSDAVYNYRMEIVRPIELHWDRAISRHDQAIRNAINTLDKISPWLGKDWTYGNIAVMCGLDYVRYRATHIDWQKSASQLASWHCNLSQSDIWMRTNAYDEVAS